MGGGSGFATTGGVRTISVQDETVGVRGVTLIDTVCRSSILVTDDSVLLDVVLLHDKVGEESVGPVEFLLCDVAVDDGVVDENVELGWGAGHGIMQLSCGRCPPW